MPARLTSLPLALSLVAFLPAQASAAFPALAEALRTRGEQKLDRGDWSGAVADFGAAVALEPSARNLHLRARAHAERAWEWGSRDDSDRATADATRALALDPSLTDAHACLGLAHSLRCEHDPAARACDRAVAGGSAVALRYRGIVRWRQCDYAGAVADYTAAIARDPRNPWAYQERACVLEFRGESDKALADADNAIELAPDAPGMYTMRSYVYLCRRDFDRARADAEKAVRLAPNDPDAHVAVSDVHVALRESPKALAALDRAVSLAPGSARVFASRADCRLHTGEPDLALADCRRALRIDPCHRLALTVAADSFMAKLESARAIAACDHALRLYPREPDFLVTRGEAKAGRGDQAGSAADLRAALELDPRCSRAMVSRAVTHILDGKPADALPWLDKALAVSADDAVALAYRAACLERLGRSDDAEKSFAAAVKLDRPEAHFDRGWARLSSGDERRGMEDINAAVRERPDAGFLLYRAWEHLFTSRDAAKALADADRAVRLAPGNSYGYVLRAQCRDAKEDNDGAIADLDRAIAIDPACVEALTLRATLLFEKDKLAAALDDCDDALAVDPDDADALSTRAMLFAALEESRAAKLPAVVGLGPLPSTRLQGPDVPRAFITPGGIRIRGGELPAWIAEPTRRASGPALAPVQATSADGRLVAVGFYRNPEVLLYDARSGTVAHRFTGHAFGTLAVCFSPDGKHLVTAGRDGCLRAWDAETGREVWSAAGITEDVRCLACSPDGRFVASGHAAPKDGGNGLIRLWEFESGAKVRELPGHNGGTLSLAFLAGGRLFSGGQDAMLREWDARTGKALGTGSLRTQPTAVAVAPDGQTIVYAAGGSAGLGAVRGNPPGAWWAVGGPVRFVSADANGRRAVATMASGSVVQFHLPLTFDQAVADATRAAKVSPKSDLPLLARGMCYLAAERYGQARADFTRAIELNEKNPESYFRRALVHIQAGDREKAVRDLSAAIDLNPNDGEAHLRRGLLLLKMGEFQRAKRDLDKAVEIDPKLKEFLPADK